MCTRTCADDTRASLGCRLKQCLSNLLSNAVKFVPLDGGRIILKAEVIDAAGAAERRQARPSSGMGGTSEAGGSTFPSLARSASSSSSKSDREEAGQDQPPPSPLASTTVISTARTAPYWRSFLSSSRADGDSTPQAAPDPPAAPHVPCIRFTVRDNGPGISLRDQEKLFKDFSQISPGARQAGGGSGLGLNITRRIVELHGGAVRVKSVVGQYTAFAMELPVAPQGGVDGFGVGPLLMSSVYAPLSPMSAGNISPPGYTGDGANRKKASLYQPERSLLRDVKTGTSPLSFNASTAALTVETSTAALSFVEKAASPAVPSTATALNTSASSSSSISASTRCKPVHCCMVIDDVASNRLLQARMLQRRGVGKLLVFSSGEAAVEAWGALSSSERQALSLVLCDKEMPGGMDGHETAHLLRQGGFSRALIGVTGNALAGDMAAFIAAGADAVLSKPLSVAALEKQLAALGLAFLK